MGRSNYRYTQLAIGDCGHVVGTWPQITDIGGKNPIVVCEDCTREKYSLDGEETFIWVRLKSNAKDDISEPQPKPKREKKPKPSKPLSKWEILMQQEGFL